MDESTTDSASESESPVVLRTRALTKHFSLSGGLGQPTEVVRAVDQVDLEVRRGKTLGLVGESGSGKSTLGKTIAQLLKATSGSVEFLSVEGKAPIDLTRLDGKALKAVRRELAMIFQDPLSSLDPRMRVSQLLAEPMDIQFGSSRAERRRREERAVELLEKVGLRASDMERFPHAFSGGQRQRISIARSLMLGPSVMICDEPTSALDVSIQGQIIELLETLQAQLGLSYVFISHNLAVVQHISDEIAVMYLGKIVETAKADDLFAQPLHPYTEVLLSAVYTADPDHKTTRKLMLGDIPSSINPPSGCRFHTRCRYAQPICSQLEPELRELGPHHRVACHFAESLSLEGVQSEPAQG